MMNAEFDFVRHEIHELTDAIKLLSKAIGSDQREVTLKDLNATEKRLSEKLDRIMAFEQDEIDAINAMSTVADGVSLKIDKVQTDVEAALAILKSNPGTPSQALVDALNKIKVSTATLAAGGDKLDATITDVDAVLPAPAPPGTP